MHLGPGIAPLRLSPLLLWAKGPLGGMVLYMAYGHIAMRAKYKDPPKTTAQKRNERIFKRVDAAWKNCTEAQKRAWKSYSKNRKLDGYHGFMQVNLRRTYDGLPIIYSPP